MLMAPRERSHGHAPATCAENLGAESLGYGQLWQPLARVRTEEAHRALPSSAPNMRLEERRRCDDAVSASILLAKTRDVRESDVLNDNAEVSAGQGALDEKRGLRISQRDVADDEDGDLQDIVLFPAADEASRARLHCFNICRQRKRAGLHEPALESRQPSAFIGRMSTGVKTLALRRQLRRERQSKY